MVVSGHTHVKVLEYDAKEGVSGLTLVVHHCPKTELHPMPSSSAILERSSNHGRSSHKGDSD